MNNNIIIRIENLTFKWKDTTAFEEISLDIFKSDFTLIQGISGSGKSTLLRLLARLEEPTTGTIYFNATPYSEILPNLLRRKIALIQQTPIMLEGSVYDNLMLAFTFENNKHLKKPQKNELIKYLDNLKLYDLIDKDATTLSVGQKQRVSIIRTILLEPEVLLMDEPTSALDLESRFIVESMAEQFNAEGKTVLMINHTDYCPKVKFNTIAVEDKKIVVYNNKNRSV